LEPGWLLIIGSIVTAVFTYLASLDKPHEFLWRTCILIGISMGIIAGIQSLERDQIQKEAEKDAQFRANWLQQQVQRERIKHERELRARAEKIAELSNTIAQTVTGGDSFCFVKFIFLADAPNTPTLVVFHKGKYPLQNVQIRIIDYEELMRVIPDMPKTKAEARTPSLSEFQKVNTIERRLDLGTLSPPGSGTRIAPLWKLPDRDQITYEIRTSTNFQTFYQHLKIRRINNNWLQAFRVHKYDPKGELIVLLEDVPKGFPRDASGKMNWLYH
jgi:hypothetical protein